MRRENYPTEPREWTEKSLSAPCVFLVGNTTRYF